MVAQAQSNSLQANLGNTLLTGVLQDETRCPASMARRGWRAGDRGDDLLVLNRQRPLCAPTADLFEDGLLTTRVCESSPRPTHRGSRGAQSPNNLATREVLVAHEQYLCPNAFLMAKLATLELASQPLPVSLRKTNLGVIHTSAWITSDHPMQSLNRIHFRRAQN